MKINYRNIPVLAIGLSRSDDVVGRSIQVFRKILNDKKAPTHAFFTTEDHGQLFATEETLSGLRENSLEKYAKKDNRIVGMYVWKGFDNPSVRNNVQCYLAEIRRRAGEESKYDLKGLFSFVPGLKIFCKPDPKREWCSENILSILKSFGANFVKETTLPPDKLQKLILMYPDEFIEVTDYYVKT